jgi:peptide/nickel transport system permease protein
MLADAPESYTSDPLLAFVPGVAILVSVVAFNLFGESLRRAMDPRGSR